MVQNFHWSKIFETSLIYISLCFRLWSFIWVNQKNENQTGLKHFHQMKIGTSEYVFTGRRGKARTLEWKHFPWGHFIEFFCPSPCLFPGWGVGDLLWLVHINETIIWLLFTHLHASKKRFDTKICILLVVSLGNI